MASANSVLTSKKQSLSKMTGTVVPFGQGILGLSVRWEHSLET